MRHLLSAPGSLRRVLPVAVLLLVGLVAAPAFSNPDGTAKPAPDGRLVEVKLLALNDFHGNLQPPGGSGGRVGTVEAGGAEFLATHIARLREGVRNSVVVSAGDLIGASPLLSALFRDEPTIEAMNAIGLDLNAVGNHEFDDGAAELLRMQRGGCHPEDGCFGGDGFAGADFEFLAANVVDTATGETLLPGVSIKHFQGAKVAFIGMTLEGTPSIVTPSGIRGLEFRDEVETVNALVPQLRRKGIETIVVLLHEGGVQGGGINDCAGISGPVVEIVEGFDPAVDVVVSGHTHMPYNCSIAGKLVTSASSFGRLVTDIDLTIDKKTKDVVAMRANNVIVTRDVPRDAAVTAIIDRYTELAAPLANRIIGRTTEPLLRAQDAAGESVLGDHIADAQLAATRAPELGGAQVAFMNPGGIRADLPGGDVTYAAAFTVQPFGNNLVTMTLSGAQVDTLLEQQWAGQTSPRILQVSEGFSYTWDATRPVGERVDASTIMLDGRPVLPTADYRVTVNSFLADGGDNFTVLTSGRDRLGGVVDLVAFEEYLAARSPLAPTPRDRISRLG